MFNHPNNSKNSKILSPSNQSRVNAVCGIIDNNKTISNFNRKDEYVDAMVEDLCDWLNFLYKLSGSNEMTSSSFFSQLQDGVILNKHANSVQYLAEIYLKLRNNSSRDLPLKIGNRFIRVPNNPPKYVIRNFSLPMNSFHKRDNVANFIHWCRDFNIPTGLTFESEDLIMMKHPRNVVVCLLEVARIGKLFGMEVPDIIQLEEDIDNEISNEFIKNDEVVSTKNDDFIETDMNENIIRDISDNFTNVTMRRKPKQDDIKNTNVEGFVDTEIQTIDFSNVTMRKIPIQCNIECSKVTGYNDNLMRKLDYHDNVSKSLESNNIELNSHFVNCTQRNEFQSSGQIENSDSDSVSSHGTQFVIPKYKAFKPVGRVKIYDCFDQSNLVKEKKYREKCDLRSLDERVRDILSECQCAETFPMKRISEGKYQWGDKKTLIFVRILRNHVMVRVGGGWDTLNEFLRKHDHCRKDRNDFQRPPFASSTNKKQKYLNIENKSSKLNFDYSRRHSMVPTYVTTTEVVLSNENSTLRPVTLTVSQSNNSFLSNFKTSENEVIESNCQPISSDFSDSSTFSLANYIGNSDKTIIGSRSATCNPNRISNIQSNQKHFSRIPILKKR